MRSISVTLAGLDDNKYSSDKALAIFLMQLLQAADPYLVVEAEPGLFALID